jgi:fucose permease
MGTTVTTSKKSAIGPLLRLQIGLGFLAFILMGMNDGILGVLLPSIRAYYQVDKATVSLIFLASTFGYLTSAFLSGLLVAKIGIRNLLLLGVTFFLVGLSLLSLQVPFLVLPVCLYCTGFGIGIFDAGLNSYFAHLPRNTVLLNLLHAFYGAGALIAPLIASGLLALNFFWTTGYLILIGVGLLVLVGILVFYPSMSLKQPDKLPGEAAGQNVLFSILRLRVVWLAAAFLLFYVGAEVSMGTWSYSFLTEERHEEALLSGWAVSGFWLGLTIGRLSLGLVGERFGNKRLIQGCLGGIVVGVLLIWLVPFGPVTALGLWLTGFSLGPIFPTTIALISNLVPSRLVPSAIGFVASLGSMGAAFFPWLAGNLAQGFGLWTLLPFMVALTVSMLVAWALLQAGPKAPRPVEET